MKKIDISHSEQLVYKLILHSYDSPESIGLLTGQMGIVITLARCFRQFQLPSLEPVIDYLFDNIAHRVAYVNDIGFSSGITGIGWGVEYLVQHKIMPGPANDLIGDIDDQVMCINVNRVKDFSLDNGVLGLWHYICARIQGNLIAGLPVPFDNRFIDDWKELIRSNQKKMPVNSMERLLSMQNQHFYYDELNVCQFVQSMNNQPQEDYSLYSGLAGYIEQKYLKQ